MKNDFRIQHWILSSLLSALLVISAGAPIVVNAALPDYDAIIANSDRSNADREMDKRRNAKQLLMFTGVAPGMRVLEIGAGGGYTAELLARAVGSRGVVYAQNVKPWDALDERMQTYGRMRDVPVIRPVIRPFDDPAPPEANNLDLITVILIYHDITYLPVDRVKMNRRFFELLKSGGHLVIVDHSAKTGTGTSVGKSLHRIEEATVRQEVEAAGFRLEAESDFLRDPNDSRDSPFREMSDMVTDRFALKFIKP